MANGKRVQIGTVDRDEMIRALGVLAQATEKGSSIPVLRHIHLATAPKVLKLAASDLDHSVRLSVVRSEAADANVARVVPCKEFRQAIDACPDSSVDIYTRDGQPRLVQVESGSFRASIATEASAEDFPRLAEMPTPVLTVDASVLQEVIQPCRRAITKEDTRYFLNGGQVTFGPDRVLAVATDGHRMMRAWRLASGLPSTPVVVLVHIRAMSLINELRGSVEVAIGPSHIYFRDARLELVQRKIDASFPNYERVYPKDNGKNARVSVAPLLQAVQALLPFAARSEAIQFVIGRNRFSLSAKNYNGIEAQHWLPAAYDGDPIELALNGRFVTDVLEATASEDVEFSMKDAMTQVVVRPCDASGFDAVVMPMRT